MTQDSAAVRRDRHRCRAQRPDLGAGAPAGRPAHPAAGVEALHGRHGLQRGAVRRLPLRDRRLGADQHVGGGQPRARPGRAADRRPRGHVGLAARQRRRAAHLLHRPDAALRAPRRRARRGRRQRDGDAGRVEHGAGQGARAASRRGPSRGRSTRCTPAPPTPSSARPSTTSSTGRSPTCSTGSSPTRTSTARCAGCCRSSPSTPSTAARRRRAPRRRWPTGSRCRRPRRSSSPRSGAASACCPSTWSTSSPRRAASCG